MSKKDKSITGIEHKYEILKQSKSNNIDYKICIPKWNNINRINPSRIWNKSMKQFENEYLNHF